MPVELSIRDNIAQVQKRLTNIERKQIPFATAGAINDTLFDIRKQIVGTTGPRSFDIRNRRFLNAAIRVRKASKRHLTGEVYDHLGRGQLQRHAKGGIKRPRGRHIAIPGRDIEGKRSGSTGKIPKRLTPRTVLNKAGRRRAFITTFKSGQRAIVRRKGKKQLPLQILYLLERQTRIRKSFRFHEDATKVARRVFQRHFNRRLRQALRTAR